MTTLVTRSGLKLWCDERTDIGSQILSAYLHGPVDKAEWKLDSTDRIRVVARLTYCITFLFASMVARAR